MTADAHHHDDIHPLPQNWLRRFVFSTDHKVIGVQFLISSLVWLGIGGMLALLLRWQLAFPWTTIPFIGERLFSGEGGTISADFYNMLFTMHGSIMVFLVVIPLLLGAFANYLIPLQIGARDMAFPTLNMLSYWAMWPAYFCFAASFFVGGGAAQNGWTSYPPLANLSPGETGGFSLWEPSFTAAWWTRLWAGSGQTLWLLGVTFSGTSSMMGSINYMTTILCLRAPGLTMGRLPLTIWSLFITSFLQAFALPVLTAAGFMLLMDRVCGTAFFSPSLPASPLLYQHLFWFYSHPAVYIMVLPAMGMVSEVLATFSRKPVFGYRPMVISMATIAGLGFVVWGHHMFTSGISPVAASGFMVSTMFIALPSAVKVFNWLATMHGGRIVLVTPMLHAIGFVSLFIVGGLSGIYLAITPVDAYFHDTYFVVAHFHFILAGGSLFGIFAGITYWWPKITGRRMFEWLGQTHFLLSFLFINGTFYTMHQLGFAGMVRRVADPYTAERLRSFEGLNQLMTYCAIGMASSQLLLLANMLLSLLFGRKAGDNPWQATTLEWTTTSPPPHYNFLRIPVVVAGPHEYSTPGATEDFLPMAAADRSQP